MGKKLNIFHILRRAVVFFVILIIFNGCAIAELQVAKDLDIPITKVVINIKDKTKANNISEKQMASLRSIFTAKLSEVGITVTTTGDAPTITGYINIYDRGNRFLRWLIGFGAGSGTLNSIWKVTNSSNKLIGDCKIIGSISGGFFGGNFDGAIEESAEKLVEFFNRKEAKK